MSFLDDLKHYVSFEAEDAAVLARLHAAAAAALPPIADHFYAVLARHPSATAVITGGDAQIHRAAAAVLLLLGHNFVWPSDDLERHLTLAITRMEEIIAKGLDDDARESIQAELGVLRKRLSVFQSSTGALQPAAPDGRWWCF